MLAYTGTMQIAVAHGNMDFDSLSAQYALTRLNPTCRMVLGYPLTGSVRNFLVLNRDHLPIVDLKYIDPERINKVYMVDSHRADRLDSAAQKLLQALSMPVTVYDHHELIDQADMSIRLARDSRIEAVGAATTLVVEQIIDAKVPITPFDATVMAIGIYEDTGCLTYSGTTARDARCLAYLLEKGADLTAVREYTRPQLKQAQIDLFETLLQSSENFKAEGRRVVIARGDLPEYVDGLATVTRQLMEVEDADAAFCIVRMKDRVHVVGRSDVRSISAQAIVRQLGGDGHPGAGSAVVKGVDLLALVARVKAMVLDTVSPQPVAADIMTSPVRTIRSDISMEEAGRLMLRYGLDGLVVSEDEQVIGVISRRDVDQSAHHKLGHARVAGFMSKPVVTVSADAPLDEMQKLMVSRDIGRLPVVDGQNRLIGLVTRQDVLKGLFGEDQHDEVTLGLAPKNSRNIFYAKSVARELYALDPVTRQIMRIVGDAACKLEMAAFAVGGFVRDLLLGLANYDLDFVIEGDAQIVAASLATDFADRFVLVATHERFKTATLDYKVGDGKVISIDLSTARTEIYEYPAALPQVEPSSLEQDLSRRDFTINAMAICINPQPERWGQLIDFFDGLGDLAHKTIRILHPFSFIEDPTRILRAVRFASRLDFELDPKSSEQARRAIAIGDFDDLGGVRIKSELQMILESPQRLKALDMLGKLGANLRYLDAQLEYTETVRTCIRRAERLVHRYPVDEPWVVYLGALLCELPYHRLPGVMRRLHLANKHAHIVEAGLELHRHMPISLKEMRPSEIYALMHGLPPESLALAAAIAEVGTFFRRAIKLYMQDLRHFKLAISGRDLIAKGMQSGPGIGALLEQVHADCLDQLVSRTDYGAQLDYAMGLLREIRKADSASK